MTNRQIKILRTSCVLIILVLIAVEIGVLLQVRRYMPGGWAPVLLIEEPSVDVVRDPPRHLVQYENHVLDLFRNRINLDHDDTSELPTLERVNIIREWVRQQPDELGVEITSQDPCEILAQIESGARASCQPLAILMVAASDSSNLQARRVALFGSPGSFDNAHSTVEVWIDGKWVIQDPTFNSVALDDNGEMLSVLDVQRRYRHGEEVNWVQDMTVGPPDFNEYFVDPSTLFEVTVYQMYEYPSGISKWESRWLRFSDRITGHVQSVVLSNVDFPLLSAVLSGDVDRMILVAIAVCLGGLLIPWRKEEEEE